MNTVPNEQLALCIDCNYRLNNLHSNRCPECGRPFDLTDEKTINVGRSLTAYDRWLARPIGWPMFVYVGALCGGFAFLALNPSIYYMLGYLVLGALHLFAVSAPLVIRRVIRSRIPLAQPKARDRIVIRQIAVVVALTYVAVAFQVPIRVAFLIARPGLNQVVDVFNKRPDNAVLPPTRLGIYVLSTGGYGDDGVYFFHILNQPLTGGGFAYCPHGNLGAYYNSGADGYLGGGWYWWTDD